jgi:hypothetical protein
MPVANTPAYYNSAIIGVVLSSIVQPPGSNAIKTFFEPIYSLSISLAMSGNRKKNIFEENWYCLQKKTLYI